MRIHGHSIGRRFVVGLGITALLVLGAATNASAEPLPLPGACAEDFSLSFEVLQDNTEATTFIRGDETIVPHHRRLEDPTG